MLQLSRELAAEGVDGGVNKEDLDDCEIDRLTEGTLDAGALFEAGANFSEGFFITSDDFVLRNICPVGSL
jgi:hypothetical protein